MANDIDPLGQVHVLLDPLRDGGVLTAEECDELCKLVEEFIKTIRAPHDGRSQSLYDYLYAAPYRIAGSGGIMDSQETFRLCPHIYNTKADIDKAVTGMTAWYDRR